MFKVCKILLVEDHAGTANAMARLLRSCSHEVHVANSCQAALSVFMQEAFDLVVTDIMLPDGNGIDLYAELRARKTVPIIAVTAAALPLLKRVEATGFDAVLLKPVNFQKLQATIEDAIRRSSVIEAATPPP